MFGISYFPFMNARGTEMLLGVDPLGINVYDKSDRLTPKLTFPWSEIKKGPILQNSVSATDF
jgi:hypothetical protein